MEEALRYSTILMAGIMIGAVYWTGKKRKESVCLEEKRTKLYFYGIFPALLFLSFYLILSPAQIEVTAMWKRICIAAVLWPVAYVDFKKHLIPNTYLLLALGCRVVIFLAEVLQSPMNGLAQLISEIIGSLVLLAFCLLMRLLSRKGLGMGDVKLFAVLPLFLGVLGGMRALLYAMILIFIQSCFCLITKRKGKKDVLPFAPAIEAGVWIVILLSGI